jgi:GNAT superfamily N-acetyltransferase
MVLNLHAQFGIFPRFGGFRCHCHPANAETLRTLRAALCSTPMPIFRPALVKIEAKTMESSVVDVPSSGTEPNGAGGLIFNIRRASGDDAAFVFAFWLQDHFERSWFAKGISKTDYMRCHHLILERIIARSVVYVACDPEVPAVAYGFACGEGSPEFNPTLHYVYVKRRFRRHGVGASLAARLGVAPGRAFAFTHLTSDGVALRKKYLLGRYLPYAA